jgi:site-specific DNA-cytosine methylase
MKAISLFSGAGGMDLGITQAGFDILASVELDKHACSTRRDQKREKIDHCSRRRYNETKPIRAEETTQVKTWRARPSLWWPSLPSVLTDWQARLFGR